MRPMQRAVTPVRAFPLGEHIAVLWSRAQDLGSWTQ